jgi:hypothetical protein
MIYHYNPETGDYTGESFPAYDPLESKKQGKLIQLMPPNSTDKVPDLTNPTLKPVFNMVKGAWDYVPSTPYITVTSNPVHADYLTDFISKVNCKPWVKDPELNVSELSISDLRTYLKAKVNAYYLEAVEVLYTLNAPMSDGWYQRLVIEAGQVMRNGSGGCMLSAYAKQKGLTAAEAANELLQTYTKQSKYMGMAMGVRSKLLNQLDKAFTDNLSQPAIAAAMLEVNLNEMLDVINKPI